MASEDYPYCIYCGEKVYALRVEGGLVVHLCSNCGHETSVRDAGFLPDSGRSKGC